MNASRTSTLALLYHLHLVYIRLRRFRVVLNRLPSSPWMQQELSSERLVAGVAMDYVSDVVDANAGLTDYWGGPS